MGKRAVFLVHGVGSQRRGEFLADVVEPWVGFLRGELATLGYGNVHFDIQLRPEEGPARATLDFLDEHWDIWEVYWARSFYPIKPFRVMLWGFQLLRAVLLFILQGVFDIIPFFRSYRYPDPSDPVYQKTRRTPGISVWRWLYYLVAGLPLVILWPAIYLVALFLATVFFVLAQLPPWLLFPTLFRRLVVGLTEVLVEGVGDQAAMLLSPAALGAMKKELLSLMDPYFNTQAKRSRACDTATIVTHSGGATVTLAVLSDPHTWERWAVPGGKAAPQVPPRVPLSFRVKSSFSHQSSFGAV